MLATHLPIGGRHVGRGLPLRAAGVDVLTLGQYLRPTERHLAVVEYVTPEQFDAYRVIGEGLGFRYVASGPMVRSSYKAGEVFMSAILSEREAERKAEGAAAAAAVPLSGVWVPPPAGACAL